MPKPIRKAYAAESAALKAVGRPIVFSESAPAYFQDTPDWYDVLTWVRDYGQLWREGYGHGNNFHAEAIPTLRASTACFGTTPIISRWADFRNLATGMMPTSSSAAIPA